VGAEKKKVWRCMRKVPGKRVLESPNQSVDLYTPFVGLFI